MQQDLLSKQDLFQSKPVWAALVIFITIAVFGIYSIWWQDYLIKNTSEYLPPIEFGLLISFVICLLFGFGWGTTILLIVLLRKQISQTFRPNQSKILLALVIMVLFPVAALELIPIPLGLALIFVNLTDAGVGNGGYIIAGKLIAIIMSYGLACLYVQGIPNWNQRLWVILGFFTTGYTTFALYFGLTKGVL